MWPHPEFTKALATINMREIAEEAAHRRLVTEAMKAQQTESNVQPSNPGALRILASQFLHKLSLPVWEAVAKHG
jgi:hypothetical protein